jgi:hypothetical protein
MQKGGQARMSRPGNTVTLTFSLPPSLRRAVQDGAEAEGRTLSDFIRRHFAAKLAPSIKITSIRKTKGGKAK